MPFSQWAERVGGKNSGCSFMSDSIFPREFERPKRKFALAQGKLALSPYTYFHRDSASIRPVSLRGICRFWGPELSFSRSGPKMSHSARTFLLNSAFHRGPKVQSPGIERSSKGHSSSDKGRIVCSHFQGLISQRNLPFETCVERPLSLLELRGAPQLS